MSIPNECECCPVTRDSLREMEPKQDLTNKFGMWLCPSCLDKETKAQAENMKPENQERRVAEMNATLSINSMLDRAKQIDNSITVRTDVFNAATVAIVDVFKSIDADASVENKPLAKAQFMLERFNHFKTVIFELNEKVVEATTQQRAYQQQLNVIANQLRQEERDRLKLADINYKPSTPKISKPRATSEKISKPKFDKAELKRVAAEMNITEFTLQMVCTSKNMSPVEAGAFLKKMRGDSDSGPAPVPAN